MIPEDAVLLCDKPPGITSHDLVAEVKRELRAAGLGGTRRRGPRVGHAGTLDPFATGLLVVLTGRATRLQRYLMGLPKTYRAKARLGWRSSTGDPDGELRQTGVVPQSLQLPTGRIRQRLPMTSAVKVDGERLYRKAHRGESIETPEREVTIFEARQVGESGGEPEYEITCSSGTYIRVLVETLEDAYCSSLRRTAIGRLRLVDGERRAITAAEALGFLPVRRLSSTETKLISDGRPIDLGTLLPAPRPIATVEEGEMAAPESPAVAVLSAEDRLVAVARPDGERLRPEVVLL